MFGWLVLLLLVVIMVGYLKFWWSHRRILATASRLPCPPTTPFLGNALFFTGGITNVTASIIKFTTEFRGMFCLWLGPVPIFVVSEPKDVQAVLNSSNTLEKDEIYQFLKPFLGNGLLTAPVPMWKKYRRILTPMFLRSNMEQFVPEFNDVSRNITMQLGCVTPVDPRAILHSNAVDAVMTTVLGRRTLDSKTKEDILYLLDNVGRLFTYRLFKLWLQIEWLFNTIYYTDLKMVYQKLAACLQVFDQEWRDEEVKRASLAESNRGNETGVKRQTILDVAWLNPETLDEDHKWSDECITTIVGATDTVVAALTYLMVSIAVHPHVQTRIREEIWEVMGDPFSDTTPTDLDKMKYLDSAILEAMRIHGVFPVIFRKATKDTILNKSTERNMLPAGSRILIALHAMGLDNERFPEPKEFLPERFLDTSEANQAFLPFSRGPRNCPGKWYTMLFMKTVMVHLIRKYQLTTTVKLENIKYDLKVVLISRTPLPITFEPLK